MDRDIERSQRVQARLHDSGMDALVCCRPSHVLLVSGYWPVVGTAVAVADRDGGVVVLAPDDERPAAEHGWADEVRTYQPATLQRITTAAEAILQPLSSLLKDMRLTRARLGYAIGETVQPSSYAAAHEFGTALERVLVEIAPEAMLLPADALMRELMSRPTPREVERIHVACQVAARAFEHGAAQLREGLSESEVANGFREGLNLIGDFSDVHRAEGFAYCMSGRNAAGSKAAYQQSGNRSVRRGDLLLVHCNSFADGYWTDISRTYCLGKPDGRQREMYQAVAAARTAALAAVRPGVRASDVDAAARDTLRERGFGDNAFATPTGHGVGFAAIDHAAPPRLHPQSDDSLEPGMVSNIEPGIYLDGYGGMRHCDVVAVTAAGVRVLTPFHRDVEQLSVT